MIKFIVSAVLVVLTIASGLLTNVWVGFYYFTLAFVCLLSLFWSVILIRQYIIDYYKDTDEDYRLFAAKLINSKGVTLKQIEDDPKRYKRKFQFSQWKYKWKSLLPIAFCVGFVISCLLLIIMH